MIMITDQYDGAEMCVQKFEKFNVCWKIRKD